MWTDLIKMRLRAIVTNPGQFTTMITYCSDGFRPIKHGEHGIDGPLAAAVAFASRLAHREFRQGGLCRTMRLDSSSRDGMHGRYEAFIGAPTERRTTAGHNVWIEVDIKRD